MESNLHMCPHCTRPAEKISENGLAGFCPVHKWYKLEKTKEAEKEAARLNKELIKKEKKEKKQKEKQKKIKKFLSTVVRISIIGMILLVAAILLIRFKVIPEKSYGSAEQLLEHGKYSEARGKFLTLGSYQDSEEKALLCDAMISFQKNDLDGAVKKINEIKQSKNGELEKSLRTSLISEISHWKERGIEPETLLVFLQKSGIFDVDKESDIRNIFLEAHAAMTGGEEVLSWYSDDMNEDQEEDLIVLKDDYSVTTYEMSETENVKMTVDKETEAKSLLFFGDQYIQEDSERALKCYQAAYKKWPDASVKEKIADTYQKQALACEAEEDYEGALTNIKYAYEALQEKEQLRTYYDMMLRYIDTQDDMSQKMILWDNFFEENEQGFAAFNMEEEVKKKTGELRSEYAEALVSKKDPSCCEYLRGSWECGKDIRELLQTAIETFDSGETKIELCQLAVDISRSLDDPAAENQLELLSSEIDEVLDQWKALGIETQKVFHFLVLAKKYGCSLHVDTRQVYEEAALGAVALEGMTEYTFADFDSDGWEELLGLNEQGGLVCYAMQEEEFSCVSRVEEEYVLKNLYISENQKITAESDTGDVFVVYSCENQTLSKIYEESGIVNCQYEEEGIRFDRLLEGSIERYQEYEYNFETSSESAMIIGLNWQKDDYPLPQTAEEAVERYFETLGYKIPEEASLLTAEEACSEEGFSFETHVLPIPDMPLEINISPYDVEEEKVLLEIVYSSEQADVITYAAAVKKESWKLAGFSNTYMSGAEDINPDVSIPLLPLNGEYTGKLEDKNDKDTYRILLSTDSRVQLVWQAGEEQGIRDAYTVSLYSRENLSDPIISYDLKLSASRQMATPLFLSPGLYYVVVESKKYEDCEYHLTFQSVQSEYAESESNNTISTATEIELNQSYTASLYEKNDIDMFLFSLEEPGAVSVSIEASSDEGKQTRYELRLMDAVSGTVLTNAQMPGNVKKAVTVPIYLSKGRYVAEVTKGRSWSSWEYQIRVDYSNPGLTEAEKNNTPETATEIPVNEKITGSFGIKGDIDCFRFALENDSLVQPKLSFDPLEKSSKTYVMTILKGAETLQTVDIGGKESDKMIQVLALKAGIYTLKLENPNFVQQDYSLRIVTKPVSMAEEEINDTLADATELHPGIEITGVLNTKKDVDLYKLTLEEEMTATLKFSFPQSTKKTTVYKFSLERNGKSQSYSVKGESGGFEQQLQISAGEYYLRVKSASWIGSVYTISLK